MTKNFDDQSFSYNFYQCCVNSCTALAVQKGKEDPEYVEAVKQSKKLAQKIIEALGDESDLLLRYEEAENAKSAINFDFIYQQGFHDCVYLLRWMDVL